MLVLCPKLFEFYLFPVYRALTLSQKVVYKEYLGVGDSVPKYQLRGVISHHGTFRGGHYTSVVRSSDDQWYHCDDNQSPKLNTTAFALSREAFMLVYEKEAE